MVISGCPALYKYKLNVGVRVLATNQLISVGAIHTKLLCLLIGLVQIPYILVYKSNACISRTLFLKPKIQHFLEKV